MVTASVLMMEYVGGGELYDYISADGGFDEEDG